MNSLIFYLGTFYILIGTIFLTVPLIYLELGKPKDLIKSFLNLLIGLILIIKNKTLDESFFVIFLFLTVLVIFYLVELFLSRWYQLTDNEKKKLTEAFNAAKEFNISVLLKGANSVIADNRRAWQLFGTDSQTARAGLGDLLSGFIAGSSAIDLTFSRDITTDLFAKYVLLHSFAASKCKKGSNASAIGDELSKLMRNIKMRQIS